MKKHPFEYSIGLGPYQILDYFELDPDDDCDYCKHCMLGFGREQPIRRIFVVENGAGEQFRIGRVCITELNDEYKEKADGKELISRYNKKKTNAKKEAKRLKQRKQTANLARKTIAAKVDSEIEYYKAAPHPSIPGKSRFDYYLWCLHNCSDESILRIGKKFLEEHGKLFNRLYLFQRQR